MSLFIAPTDLSTPPQPIAHATDVDEFRVADNFVAYVRTAEDGLHRTDLDDGQAHPVMPDLANVHRYNWALRNGRVFYVRTREGESLLMRYDPRDQSHHALIPLSPSAVAPTLSVAPDESYIMVAMLDELRVDLHWVPPP